MESILCSHSFEEVKLLAYNVFTINNPLKENTTLHAPFLKVTVLDSTGGVQMPLVAAVIVRSGFEDDLQFTTKEGYNGLIKKFFNVSRLCIVANKVEANRDAVSYVHEPSDEDFKDAENGVNQLLQALLIDGSSQLSIWCLPRFLDNVVYRRKVGSGEVQPVGGFHIADEVVLNKNQDYELRRRLRFNSSPANIYLEVRLIVNGVAVSKIIDDLVEDDKCFADTSEIFEPKWNAIKFGLYSTLLKNDKKSHLGVSYLLRSGKKKTRKCLLFGCVGPAVLSFLENDCASEVVFVHRQADSIKGITEIFDMTVTVYKLSPKEVLQNYQGVKVEGFSKNTHGFFDILVFDDLEDVITPETIRLTRNVLKGDGMVVLNLVPASYIDLVECVMVMKEVFSKVMKIRVSENNLVFLCMLSTSSTSDSATSAPVVEEFVKGFTEM